MTFIADQPIEAPELPIRLCTDCKHHKDIGSWHTTTHGCSLDACGSYIDPVDGLRFYKRCSAARRKDGACGPEGKLWETSDVMANNGEGK